MNDVCEQIVRPTSLLLVTALFVGALLLENAAWGASVDPNASALRLIKTIAINGTAASPNTKMYSFGSSWVDPANGLLYLADRSNADIDVVDTTGAFAGTPDTLFGQIGGSAFSFAGDTGNPATSGPNDVVVAYPCIFVTDSNRVVSINASISFTTPVNSSPGFGSSPANAKMAFDPNNRLLLVTYSEKPTSFVNEFAVSSTCQLNEIPGIPFDSAHGVNATSGVGQPVWEPGTQRFYVSIPEVNGPGDGTGTVGAVVQIAPKGFAVVGPPPQPLTALYRVNYCQPLGLTVGPNGDLLVGCSRVFDTSGNICTLAVPSPSPTGAPAACTGIAFPQEAICNPGRGCNGNALVSVPGVGGGSEVWFNSGDGNYYVAAENDPVGPVFGVIASGATATPNTLTQILPTLPPVPAVAGVHSVGAAQSIAASAGNNHVYVAMPTNTAYPSCMQGCIAVYSAQ